MADGPETGEGLESLPSAERPDPLHPHGVDVAVGWVGHKLDDMAGDTVGRVEEVLVVPETDTPSWLLVKLGRFGGHRTAVPFEFAAAGVDHVWVPYPRETIRAAPEVLPRTGLDPDLEAALRRHYGMPEAAAASGDGAEPGNGTEQPDAGEPAAD